MIDFDYNCVMLDPFGATALGPRGTVVEKLIPEGVTTSMFAARSTGKSLIAAHIALRVIEGRDFHGLKTTPGPVLYLDAETERRDVEFGLKRILDGLKMTAMPPDFHYLEVPYGSLGAPGEIAKIIALTKNIGQVLTIVDSAQFASGIDSISAKEVTGFYAGLRAFPGARLVVDHIAHQVLGKFGNSAAMLREYGSVYKGNAVRAGFGLTFTRAADGKSNRVTFTQVKPCGDALLPPFDVMIRFEREPRTGPIVFETIDATATTAARVKKMKKNDELWEWIMFRMGGHTTTDRVVEIWGKGKKGAANRTAALVKDGRLRSDGHGGWEAIATEPRHLFGEYSDTIGADDYATGGEGSGLLQEDEAAPAFPPLRTAAKRVGRRG